MKNKKTLFLTVMAITALLVAVAGATYAYFTANIDASGGKVSSVVKTSSRDVFITSGGSSLSIDVSNAFMSENDGKDDYSVSISKDGKITVSLTAGSETVSCDYDLAISNSGSVAYTKSPNLGGLFEYTVQGTDGTQSFDEINVDDAMASTISPTTADDSTKQVSKGILGNYNIQDSVDKTTQVATTQEWTITSKFYNLNKPQNDQANKTYSYDVKVVNVHCENKANPVKVISGNGTTVGDEIAIGDEHFYVISSDSTEKTVTMLAKWNLLVGNVYKDYYTLVSTYQGTEEGYGLQSSLAKGYMGKSSTENSVGTVPFTDEDGDYGYWLLGYDDTIDSKYGTEYPVYVYDDNASISTYVNNYVTLIEKKYKIEIEEARLISNEELEALTKDEEPEWIFNTTYWTGTSNSYNNIIRATSYGSIGYDSYYRTHVAGVRPVVVISTDLF